MADNSTPTGEGGGKKVRGAILPDKKNLGAHLKSSKIAAATVMAVATIGGIGFLSVKYLPTLSGGSETQTMQPHRAPDVAPPPKQNPGLAAPEAPVTSPVASGASTPAESGATPSTVAPQTAPQPAQPATPSPQQQAFEAAIGGGGGTGGSTLSWGNGQQQAATAVAQSILSNPDQELAMAKSIALMTGKAKKKGSVYDTHLVRKEVSPYELLQGSVIPALLTTGIKSDISGQVTAVVDHPVYNSLNGAYVLIPAGSKLVGTYASGAAMGQDRVGVMWTRIEFPNGTYIQLGKMEGSSPRGYAGFKDLVNNHTWEIFKNALLLSFIDVGMSIASPTSTSTNTTGVTGNQALQDGEQALAQTFGQAEAQMFQKYINIAPTITIRPGYAFNVVVTQDLVFPGPYVHGADFVGTTASGEPAAPTELDPYGG